MIPGWTGDGCEIPDCPGGCEGNGFCNGTDRDIPECDCKDVSYSRFRPVVKTFVICACIPLTIYLGDTVVVVIVWKLDL